MDTTFKGFSQARQDEFVVRLLEGRRGGVYADIGAGHPTYLSNTALLEKQYGWSGVLCDIAHATDLRKERGGVVLADAFDVDWFTALSGVARQGRIDYLSLDLEPPALTLLALTNLPLEDVRFDVITIEHDLYRGGDLIRLAMRGVLEGFKYERVASDVCVSCNGIDLPFEDWWVDPQVVDVQKAKALIAEMGVKHEG